MKALQSMSKTILITGASSGFGRDTAETLFRAYLPVDGGLRAVQIPQDYLCNSRSLAALA